MGPTQDLNKFSFYLNGDGGGTILKKIHGEFPCVCVCICVRFLASESTCNRDEFSFKLFPRPS